MLNEETNKNSQCLRHALIEALKELDSQLFQLQAERDKVLRESEAAEREEESIRARLRSKGFVTGTQAMHVAEASQSAKTLAEDLVKKVARFVYNQDKIESPRKKVPVTPRGAGAFVSPSVSPKPSHVALRVPVRPLTPPFRVGTPRRAPDGTIALSSRFSPGLCIYCSKPHDCACTRKAPIIDRDIEVVKEQRSVTPRKTGRSAKVVRLHPHGHPEGGSSIHAHAPFNKPHRRSSHSPERLRGRLPSEFDSPPRSPVLHIPDCCGLEHHYEKLMRKAHGIFSTKESSELLSPEQSEFKNRLQRYVDEGLMKAPIPVSPMKPLSSILALFPVTEKKQEPVSEGAPSNNTVDWKVNESDDHDQTEQKQEMKNPDGYHSRQSKSPSPRHLSKKKHHVRFHVSQKSPNAKAIPDAIPLPNGPFEEKEVMAIKALSTAAETAANELNAMKALADAALAAAPTQQPRKTWGKRASVGF